MQDSFPLTPLSDSVETPLSIELVSFDNFSLKSSVT